MFLRDWLLILNLNLQGRQHFHFLNASQKCYIFCSVVVDFLFIVTPIVGVCNCSMFCCTLLYVHFSIAIILMGKRELIALLNLSSWCLVMVERLFLTVPRGCLQFVIVVFPDHTHLLFLTDFFIIFMFFIFLNKNKASDQTASTGVRTQTYLQVLSYDNPRPFCQLNYTNLSKI